MNEEYKKKKKEKNAKITWIFGEVTPKKSTKLKSGIINKETVVKKKNTVTCKKQHEILLNLNFKEDQKLDQNYLFDLYI